MPKVSDCIAVGFIKDGYIDWYVDLHKAQPLDSFMDGKPVHIHQEYTLSDEAWECVVFHPNGGAMGTPVPKKFVEITKYLKPEYFDRTAMSQILWTRSFLRETLRNIQKLNDSYPEDEEIQSHCEAITRELALLQGKFKLSD